jgi:hypothetical protein
MGGEEVHQCSVIHEGISKGGGTCPLGGAAHGIDDGQ